MKLFGQEVFVTFQEESELDYKERRRKKMMAKENTIPWPNMYQSNHLQTSRLKLQNNEIYYVQ